MRCALGPARRNLSAADVAAQTRGLEFHLLHAVFDHIADRNDADQAIFFHDRHVAKLSGIIGAMMSLIV